MTDDFATAIDASVPPSGPGCVECEATGGWWFHLRRCTKCGHVGCCDSSPSQHAQRPRRREPATRWSAPTSRTRTGSTAS